MASLLFAVMHVNPHAIILAFSVGLWVGFVAWKSGSIWPEWPPTLGLVALGAATVACFTLSIRMFRSIEGDP